MTTVFNTVLGKYIRIKETSDPSNYYAEIRLPDTLALNNNYYVEVPLITANDKFVLNNFSAVLTNKSIDCDTNTVTNVDNT